MVIILGSYGRKFGDLGFSTRNYRHGIFSLANIVSPNYLSTPTGPCIDRNWEQQNFIDFLFSFLDYFARKESCLSWGSNIIDTIAKDMHRLKHTEGGASVCITLRRCVGHVAREGVFGP